MPNPADLIVDPANLQLKVCLRGPAGGGKSSMAGTFPNPLFFNFDPQGRILALRRLAREGREIRYVTYEDDLKKKIAKAYEAAESDLTKLEVATPSGLVQWEGMEVKTVVLDSLTTFADAVVLLIQKDNGLLTAKDTNKDSFPITYYNVLYGLVGDFILRLVRLPLNVILIVHDVLVKDSLQENLVNDILMWGEKGVKPKIPVWFNEMWRCFGEASISSVEPKGSSSAPEPKWFLQTMSDKRTYCKTTIGSGVFDAIEEPHYDTLMAKVREAEAR